MNDWIEINLPYGFNLEYPEEYNYLPYPDLDDEIRSVFGKTADEMLQELFGVLEFEHPLWVSYTKIKQKIQKEINKEEYDCDNYEEYVRTETDKRLQLNLDPGVKAVLAYRQLNDSIKEWYYSHPETEMVVAENTKRSQLRKEFETKNCFSHSEFNRPGVLIEVDQKGELVQFLIGHINASGGVCNESRGIEKTDIVLRCKVVWTDNHANFAR